MNVFPEKAHQMILSNGSDDDDDDDDDDGFTVKFLITVKTRVIEMDRQAGWLAGLGWARPAGSGRVTSRSD